MTHPVDDNTFALWRMNETANPTHDYALAIASVNSPGYDLAQSTATDRPLISGGPTDGSYARVFYRGASSGEALSLSAPGASFEAVWKATHRYKYWIYLEDHVASTGDVWNMGGTRTSETEANNLVMANYITSDGSLFVFWEYSASATNVNIDTGYDIPLRTWVEIDVTITIGATTAVDVVVTELGGSPSTEFSNTGYNNTTGGTSNVEFRIGAGHSSATTIFGRIADFRLWDSDDDSVAPFERWAFTEAPAVVDASGNGYHLSHHDPGNVDSCFIASPIISGNGRSRICTTTCALVLNKRQELIELLRTTHTTEMWVYRDNTNQVSHETIYEMAGGATGSAGDNTTARLAATGTGEVAYFHETGSGSGTTQTSTDSPFVANASTEKEVRYHLAIVQVDIGGGNVSRDYYKNGVHVEQLTASVGKPTGGEDPDGLFWIGRGPSGFPFNGRIDEVMISDTDRSAEEIEAHYEAGILEGAPEPDPVDTTAPVVDNYSPPVGSVVHETDPIFFDVTDDSSMFASLVVVIEQGGRTEVVYMAGAFQAPYDDLSTTENIANGLRFRVRRTDGWIDTVVQTVFVVDAAGNVAA